MTALRLPLFREITAFFLLVTLMLQSATAVAPGPAWWGTQSVADPDAFPDDFALANVGQLKYMATKAAAALEAEFPGGAGTTINALVASWSSPAAFGVTRDDYLAVNQGQLKVVASLFYDRIGQPYPWAGSSAARDDYQAVNLGQLKHVFAFELKFSSPGTTTQIPAATLAAALAQWQALPVKPAGSSTDDFDGDGIPNLQEYLMGRPLFAPLDIDGDRMLDSIEDAHPGVLSKLRFADAVEDSDGDGVMNYEELLLGLHLAAVTTSGRADGLGDAEVLAWSLAASTTLMPNSDAVRALWEVIDADWIDREVGSYYLYWLLETLIDGVPAGLTSFRADVATWAWQPWNPGVWLIESPPLAHDPNWEPVDLDGNGVADFDRDNDNLPDLWEYRYSLKLRNGQDGNSDPDGDQLPNWQEYEHGTNPQLADSDGDGFNDAMELWQGGDPVQQSSTPPLVLQVVDSSYQAIYTGQTTPALAVKVTQGGLPVAGVTVAFQLNEGGGRLKPASSTLGTPGSSLSQTTSSNGIAAVTYESAAAEPEGTASISAGIAGASASQNFTVSIVEIPAAYGSIGGSGSTVGGSGGASSNPTRVPTPPRSTAMSAASIAAVSTDGYRIRVKRKSNSQSSYPADASSLEYLPPSGLSPAAWVGWHDKLEPHSWANYTRLEFEALPPPPPSKKPVVPPGARRYLALVYQAEDVGADTSGPPKYTGVLTFQYDDKGARKITLTSGIPEVFIKKNGNESVAFEPPLATKAEERVWIRLVSIDIKIWNGQDAAAPVSENNKYTVGAFTVANLNDTDGDGGANNTLDKDDNEVAGEKDLMQLWTAGYSGMPGKVKLTVKSGKDQIKFWETKEKVTPIVLDAEGAVFFDIPAGGLGKTLWIEATAASSAVRDIEIWQGYQDAQGNLLDGLDKVKATAIWVDPGANGIITTGNQVPQDLDDGTAFLTFQALHDSKFGIFNASPGKAQFSYSIGFEFKVKPAGIGKEPDIKFDVSRQREDFLWILDTNGWFDALAPPFPNRPTVFPTVPDEPTDDGNNDDEDNTPKNDHIYSIDNPRNQFYPVPAIRVVKRANFREFIRVRFDGKAFKNLNGVLEGSRCANFQNWRMRGDITKTNGVWSLSLGGSNELQGGHVPLGTHP